MGTLLDRKKQLFNAEQKRNEDFGYSTSLSTNLDWYSPVNTKRFSEIEIKDDVENALLFILF